MLVKALKEFRYAHDGINARAITDGNAFDCRSDVVYGLAKAGYVVIVEAAAKEEEDPAARTEPEIIEWSDFNGDDQAAADGLEDGETQPNTELVLDRAVFLGTDAEDDVGPVAEGGNETRQTQRAIEIPEDWRNMHGNALRSLASKVSFDPITDRDSAVAAIEAELLRRSRGE